MDHNVVHPSAAPPPAYSELPPAAGPSAPYGQSTLLYDDGVKAQQGPPSQPAWNDPTTNQYPPAGHAQYPPPTAPAYAPYPPSGYGTPYYGGAPPPPPPPQQPQQQQQQQVVVVNGGPTQPVMYVQHQTFIGQMILACFVLWCCNCLFGLIAFILAGKYNGITNFLRLSLNHVADTYIRQMFDKILNNPDHVFIVSSHRSQPAAL